LHRKTSSACGWSQGMPVVQRTCPRFLC